MKKPSTLMRVNIKQFDNGITLQDVRSFLTMNSAQPEVASYLGELSAVSADKVKGFLETDEGKRLLQPRLDSYFSQGLDTWKSNNLDKLVDAELKKRNPDMTDEQKRIAALEKELEDQKSAAKREQLMNIAMKEANAKQLPTDVVEFFLSEDEESTKANLKKFEDVYSAAVKAAVDAKFKENGRNIPNGGAGGAEATSFADLAQKNNIRN